MVLTQQKMRIKPRTWDSRSRVSQGKRARPGLPSGPLSVLSSAKSTQGRAGAEIPSAPHSPRACVAVLAQRGRRFLVPGSMCAGCGWQAPLQGRGLWASSPRSQAGDLALLGVSAGTSISSCSREKGRERDPGAAPAGKSSSAPGFELGPVQRPASVPLAQPWFWFLAAWTSPTNSSLGLCTRRQDQRAAPSERGHLSHLSETSLLIGQDPVTCPVLIQSLSGEGEFLF